MRSLANVSASSLKWDSLTLTSKPFEAVDTLKDLATTRVEPVLASLPAELRFAHPRITLKALDLGSDATARNNKNRVARAVRNSGHTLVSSLSGFSECSIDHRQRSAQPYRAAATSRRQRSTTLATPNHLTDQVVVCAG